MKRLIAGAGALIFLAACNQQTAEPVAEQAKPLISGLDLQHMDTSVRPGDNFFNYMSGTWLKETEIPADKSSYGGFVVLADEAQENVRNIIDEAANGDFAKGSDEQKVGDLYRSYMDWDTRNELGVTPLDATFDEINALENQDDLAAFMAESSKVGVSMPLDMQQLVDWNDSSQYSMLVSQGGLGLPDREYYVLEDEKSVALREAYVAHIASMFDLAGLANGEAAAITIMALETRMAEQNMTKEQGRNRAQNYQTFDKSGWI